MRFLLDDFVDVPQLSSAPESATRRLQEETARALLHRPRGKGLSPAQRLLVGMKPGAFHALRRLIAGRLRGLAINGSVGPHRLRISVAILAGAKAGDPLYLEPWADSPTSIEDLFWYYVADLVTRAGPSQIGICPAPRSQREAPPSRQEFPGQAEYCGRLLLRRGRAKLFCSETCRSRVSTQRARRKDGRTR